MKMSIKVPCRWALALGIASVATGCGGAPPSPTEDTAALGSELAGTLIISGRVATSTGVGIAGVTVTLSGKVWSPQLTDANGNYSFKGLTAGSYSVRPTKTDCAFSPDVVNLNNLTRSAVRNFVASGGGCSGSASPAKAMILVDQRLYNLLSTEITDYRNRAQQRRGFSIDLRAVSGIDDWAPATVKSYVASARAQNPSLEGVLFMGNIKLPSFYKPRADIAQTRIYPMYYQDLDAVFSKTYADGAIDPACNDTNGPDCAVGGDVIVPAHDFDHLAKGPQPDPELWASFMPVGVSGTQNTYADFATQLRPYLQKLGRYHAGQVSSNGRFYGVSNDKGERFELTWSAFGSQKIDFYGKPGPNGEVGSACIVGSQNLCYVRWPTETYPDYPSFEAAYAAQPWVDEGWQTDTIFLSHMNAALYDVVEVNVHSWEGGSLISTDQAKSITKGGLLVVLDGCSVGGFGQPGSPSYVDDSGVMASDNVMLAYLYGSSQALAVTGDPFNRGHYADAPVMFVTLKTNHGYLGRAHLDRMKENYARAGDSTYDLKEWAAELLVGDPFMDLP
jgi:hypothetical protein